MYNIIYIFDRYLYLKCEIGNVYEWYIYIILESLWKSMSTIFIYGTIR